MYIWYVLYGLHSLAETGFNGEHQQWDSIYMIAQSVLSYHKRPTEHGSALSLDISMIDKHIMGKALGI